MLQFTFLKRCHLLVLTKQVQNKVAVFNPFYLSRWGGILGPLKNRTISSDHFNMILVNVRGDKNPDVDCYRNGGGDNNGEVQQ